MENLIMNIIRGPAAVTRMVKNCIRAEMTPDGLLREVETFVPAYQYEEEVDEPLVWMYEHETTRADGTVGVLGKKQLLQTPYEFFCVVYDSDGLEESEIQGKDLATRVAASILKNARRKDETQTWVFDRILFDTLYPSGTVDIVEKNERAVVVSIKLMVEYFVDWSICFRKNYEEEEKERNGMD